MSDNIIYVRTKFAQSSRKHRIGKAHAIFVMENNEPDESINESGEREFAWIGLDDRGVELEIAAVIPAWEDDLLLVLHVMPTQYRE
jgi:hypothetical protein